MSNGIDSSNAGKIIPVFSCSDNRWSSPTLSGKNTPQLRRNHIAEVVGSQMLIRGGVGDNNEILSDCYLLNFSPLKCKIYFKVKYIF